MKRAGFLRDICSTEHLRGLTRKEKSLATLGNAFAAWRFRRPQQPGSPQACLPQRKGWFRGRNGPLARPSGGFPYLGRAGQNLVRPSRNLCRVSQYLVRLGQYLVRPGQNLVRVCQYLVRVCQYLVRPGQNLVRLCQNLVRVFQGFVGALQDLMCPSRSPSKETSQLSPDAFSALDADHSAPKHPERFRGWRVLLALEGFVSFNKALRASRSWLASSFYPESFRGAPRNIDSSDVYAKYGTSNASYSSYSDVLPQKGNPDGVASLNRKEEQSNGSN